MYKLIVFLVAAIPIVLFLRTIFFKRSKVARGAVADLKRHIDYLVWAILFLIGCTLVYAVAKVAYTMWQ
jgi:hypothetical protein